MSRKYQQMNFDLEPLSLDFDASSKEKLAFHINAGDYVECPCCSKKFNVIYKRRLYKTIVQGLRNLHQKKGFNASLSDFSKLKHWNLIEETNSRGHWRITQTGIDFLAGKISVSKYVFIQNNNKIGESHDDLISVYDIKD